MSTTSGIHQVNVYWKLVRPLRSNALHSAHGNLVHATSLLWDFITYTTSTEKWVSCYLSRRYKREKNALSHKMMNLDRKQLLWKGKKISYMHIPDF